MFALLVAASADVPPNRFVCDEHTVSVIAPATITRAFSVETEVHWSAKRQFGLRGADAAALTAQLYQRYLGEDAYTLNFLDDRLEETGKPGETLMLDVGCNHGFYSLWGAAAGLRSQCFEPQAGLLPCLRRAAGKADPEKGSVTVHQLGLSNQPGRLSLHGSGGTAFLKVESASAAAEPAAAPVEAQSIPITTLDGFVREKEPAGARVAMLKVDVEGLEMAVLQGGKGLFAAGRVSRLLVEVSAGRWASRSPVAFDAAIAVLEGLMGRYTAEFWMPRAAALAVGFDASRNASALARPPRMSTGATPPASVRAARHVRRVRARKTQRQIDRWLDRTVSAAHCPAVLAPLAQGGELAPSKKLMAAAKLSRGSSLLRWRRRGNLRQEPEVDDGVVWHIRVAPGAWRAVITELVAQGKDVACDFFFERK